jgi:amino acid adenylation domain-containing protein
VRTEVRSIHYSPRRDPGVVGNVTSIEGSEGHDGARAYWRRRLARFGGPTRVVRGVGRGSLQGRTQRAGVALSAAEYEAAAGIGGGGALGVCAFLLGALDVCLYRYSGQTRVVVGTPALRGAGGPEPDAGAVVLLTDVPSGRPFGELVRGLRSELEDAYAHQDYPLDALIADLGLYADDGGCPLFDVALRLAELHGPLPPLRLGVVLSIGGDETGLSGTLEVDAGLLDADETARFAGYLRSVVTSALERPDSPVRTIAAIPPEVYERIVVDWNRTDAGTAAHALHRLVEAQAARRPDAVAVLDGPRSLTYAELDAQANAFARYLAGEVGVRAGEVVGIALTRSLEMAVAALAVLKAGAAYLPLDPAYPRSRLQFMLADAGAVALLTVDDFVGRFSKWDGLVVRLDTEREAVERAPAAGLPELDSPDAVACVIYTSGSTGRPKGVLLTHGGLCNSMSFEQETYGLGPGDRLLQMASFSFSLAILELFSPLCAGAQVVLAPAGATRDTRSIAALCSDYGITVLSVVPSELKRLLEQEPDMRWSALRLVVTGADVLPAAVLRRFFATCPSLRLLNVYGLTECSAECIYWDCRPLGASHVVPIGRPLANARVYVLDEDMEPVPIGVPGELFVGGRPLALGYLGRPAQTASTFVPNPFADDGSRLCRTGDNARWLDDGTLELLGRSDHQVKIRGVRVELEEIEAFLREHPAVRDAAVVVDPGRLGLRAPADEDEWEALLAQVDEDVAERLVDELAASEG